MSVIDDILAPRPDRFMGNLMGGLLQAAATPVAIPALINTLRGEKDTWSQNFMQGLNDYIARRTGVPTDKRTLVDEALSFAAPAGIVTKPINVGNKVANFVANVLVPTTTNAPGVPLRAALNTAIPTAIVGGVDAAVGGDMVGRTIDQLNPLSSAQAQVLQMGPRVGQQTDQPVLQMGKRIEPASVPPAPVPPTPASPDADAAAFETATGTFTAPPAVPGAERSFAETALGKVIIGTGVLLSGAKAGQVILRGMRSAPKAMDDAAKLGGALTDKNVPITRALEEAGVAADDVAEIGSMLQLNSNAVPRDIKIKHMLDTGELEGFGRVTAPHLGREQTLGQFLNEFSGLDPTKQAAVRRAMQIGTELDNRARGATGLNPILKGDTTDLSIERANLMSDPDVLSYIQRSQQFYDIARQYIRASGLRTPEEVRKFANTNPRYSHYPWLGPLGKREDALLDPAGTPIPEKFGTVDPIVAMSDYWTQIVHAGMKNHAQRAVMNELGSTHFVERFSTEPPKLPHELAKTVTWRDSGIKLYAVMSDEALATAIRNDPVVAGTWLKWMNSARRLEQSATTGVIAALGGVPFQPVAATYTAIAGQLTHKVGRSLGMVSDLAQQHLGVAVRTDPTVFAQAIAAFARDATRQGELSIAKRLAYDLDTNGWMSRTFGKTFVAQTSKNMLDDYRQSSLAAMRRHGAAGTGLHGVSDEAIGEGLRQGRDYLRTIAPEINHPRTAPLYRARAALENVLDLIGSSTNSAYWKQNQGRASETMLAAETRALGGDPAVSGSSAVVRGAGMAVPYLNTAVQGTRAVVNAARERPLATAAAGTVLFGMAPYEYQVYLSTLPPEYRDHFWNQITAYERGARLPLYLPGVPPERAPTIPIPNELGAYFAVAHRFFGDMLGNTTGSPSIDAEEHNIRSEFAQDKELNTALARMSPVQIPLAARLPLAAAGVDTSDMLRFDSQRFGVGRLVTGPAIAGTPRSPDNIVDGVLGSRVEGMINQIPTIGKILTDAYHAMWVGEGVAGAIDRRALVAADRNAMVRPIWGVDPRASTQTDMSQLLQQRVGTMREAVEQYRDRVNQFNMMQAGVPIVGRGPAPMSMQTQLTFKIIDDTLRRLNDPNEGLLAKRNAVLTNITRLEGTNMPAIERRDQQNALTKQANELTVRALDEIARVNNLIRGLSGGRGIDNLNPGRNVDGSPFWDGTNALVK